MRTLNLLMVLFLSHVAAMIMSSLIMPENMPDHLQWSARAFSD